MSELASESKGTVSELRERAWLAIGALVGVIVAGAVIGVLIVLSGGHGTPPARPLTSSTASSGAVAEAPVGTARDDSLRVAEEAGITLNTLDYRTAAQTLDAWEALATGSLLDDLRAKRAETASAVAKSKTTSTAKVLAVGVSKVAPDATSADVLVAVQVTTTEAKGAPTTKLVRDQLTVMQTAQGWKISAVTLIEPGA
jgi:hypothetical protein